MVAEEAAVDEGEAVALGVQCHSLSFPRSVVLDGDVFKRDVVALYLDGIGAESTHTLFSALHADVGMVVISDDGALGIFSQNLNVVEP